MKFIKCLKRHSYVDYIGIVIDMTKDIEFYTVSDIVQNKSYLLNYKVLSISAICGKNGYSRHDVPMVVYQLGI